MNSRHGINWDQLIANLPPEDLKSDSIDVGEPHTLHRRGDRSISCPTHHDKSRYGLAAISAAFVVIIAAVIRVYVDARRSMVPPPSTLSPI